MLTTQFFAMKIRRYMDLYGISTTTLGRVAEKAFENGAKADHAWRRTPVDLDTILKDRIASNDDEQDDEDEEEVAPEPGADAADRVVPRRADEFVCESCFLVKHASQRVGDGNLCRDCV